MVRDETIIDQINSLWVTVYPFMADHLLTASGLRSGEILDLGPFAGGLAVSVLAKGSGFRAKVVDESERVLEWAMKWAEEKGCAARLDTHKSPIEPIIAPDASCDLVTVRGAFFFLTSFLLREVKRVLRPGGFGWVGGGYGPRTPDSVIAPIAERSKRLNADIGKRRIGIEEAQTLLNEAGIDSAARVSAEGGLWIEVRG